MTAYKKIDEIFRELGSKDPKRCLLIYGPDNGICEAHIDTCAKLYQAQLPNCEISKFSDDDINRDFASFENSVRGASLFGSSAIAIIRARNDAIASKIGAVLNDIEANNLELSGAILIFSANLTNKSKLAQAFEKSNNAYSIRLFEPTRLELMNIIKAKAQTESVNINKEAIESILNSTVNDSNSLIAQVENLALYVGRGNEIDLNAIEALDINNRESGADELINALFVGNSKASLLASFRLLRSGGSIIPLLNAITRRCLLLNSIFAEIANGRNASEVVKDRKFGIFWKEQEIIARQCNIWNRAAIDRALHQIILADAQCKTTNLPQQEIFERLIMRISEFAKALIAR